LRTDEDPLNETIAGLNTIRHELERMQAAMPSRNDENDSKKSEE